VCFAWLYTNLLLTPSFQVDPMPFNDWVQRFDVARRLRLVAARARLDHKSIASVSRKLYSAFIKREFAINRVPTPRLIQGVPDDVQVIIGPWLAALQSHLVTAWCGNPCYHQPGMLLPSLLGLPRMRVTVYHAAGHTPAELGAWFREKWDERGWHYMFMGDDSIVIVNYTTIAGSHERVIILQDFIKFDASKRDSIKFMIYRYMCRFQPPERVAEMLCLNDFVVEGRTKHNGRYKVEGTQASGDNSTMVDNMMTNKAVSLFTHHFVGLGYLERLPLEGEFVIDHLDRPFNVDVAMDPSERSKDNNYNGTRTWVEAVTALSGDLGMPVEITLHHAQDMTAAMAACDFCSGLFYPVADSEGHGLTIHAPMIGRLIAKLCWTRNDHRPHNLAWLRGTCLATQHQAGFLPVVRAIIHKVLELTASLECSPRSADLVRIFRERVFRERLFSRYDAHRFSMNGDTWFMLMLRYGVSEAEFLDMEATILSVERLPCVVESQLLLDIIARDCPLEQSDIIDVEGQTERVHWVT